MKRYMPEFLAVPLAVVLLGLMAAILWAADAGLGAWLAVGAVVLAILVVLAVRAMRRPRPAAASDEAGGFDGGALPVDDGLRRVLLVVDGACTARDLEQLASGRGPTSVFVVAPAVSSRLARWTGDEHAYAEAVEHLEAAVHALGELGCAVRGHVGAHDPLQAADDGLREFPAEEIVFALAGDHGSGWLEDGVVDLARDRYAVPVRRLAPATPAGASRTDA